MVSSPQGLVDPGFRQEPPKRVDAQAVVAAALGSPLVAALFPGGTVEIATYLPGKRIPGVRVRERELEVHVVACWGVCLTQVAEDVRRLVTPVAGGLPVAVYVDDVEAPQGLGG